MKVNMARNLLKLPPSLDTTHRKRRPFAVTVDMQTKQYDLNLLLVLYKDTLELEEVHSVYRLMTVS